MSISPARMKRIWSKCPELRPPEIKSIDTFRDGQVFGHLILEDPFGCLHIVPASGSVIARFICDACVWWLLNKGWRVWHDEDGFGAYEPEYLRASDGTLLGEVCANGFEAFHDTDPAEACLLAVERALGLESWEKQEPSSSTPSTQCSRPETVEPFKMKSYPDERPPKAIIWGPYVDRSH